MYPKQAACTRDFKRRYFFVAAPANKGYRIWYSVVAPGETPPSSPGELRKPFYTQRKTVYIKNKFW
jgi:hypothetical protein